MIWKYDKDVSMNNRDRILDRKEVIYSSRIEEQYGSGKKI